MSIFTRRSGAARKLSKRLERDMRETTPLCEQYGGAAGDGTLDLLAYAIRAFELAPTSDIDYLISRGVDGAEFYAGELRPNWNGLTREQRSSKIAAFVRFANLLDRSDGESDAEGTERLAELRAAVRTKIVLLACAYDVEYADSYCRRIARDPQRFGDYELSHV